MTTEFMGKRYPFLSLIKSGVSGLGRGVAKWACACLARSETHSQHKKKKIKKKNGLGAGVIATKRIYSKNIK
jgi:hypothetical protein